MRAALILELALIALAVPLAAQAPGERVLPILYLPADLHFDAARLRLQVEAVRDAQGWYAHRLGGPTFYADPLVVQRSRHTFAQLADNSFQNWWPLPEREFAEYGLAWNDSSRIKLLLLAQGAGAWAGADSENGGFPSEAEAGSTPHGRLGGLAVIGDSSIGGVLAGVCPRAGEASHRKPEGGTIWWCNWNTYRGTVAHELGHTFGVPHPDAFRKGFRCDSTVITNMQCHWAWPADSLLPFEARHLRSLPFFSSDATREWRAVELPFLRAGGMTPYVFERGDALLWLTGRGGGTGHLWGVVLADGMVRWSPTAEATAFIAEVGLPPGSGGGSYRLQCGEAVVEGTTARGTAPLTVVLRVRPGCAVEARTTGTVALAHPRWSRR